MIYGREMNIVGYADNNTTKKLKEDMETGGVILSQYCTDQWGKIILKLEEKGLTVTDMKTVILDRDSGNISLIVLFRGASCESCIANIEGGGGEGDIQKLSSADVSNILADFFSNTDKTTTATLDSCSLLFIKPSLVKQQSVGNVINKLLSTGYELSAILSVSLDKASASEFLAKYEGVFSDSLDLHILEFSGGVGIAVEVRSENAVANLRKTCGPWDVDMAR